MTVILIQSSYSCNKEHVSADGTSGDCNFYCVEEAYKAGVAVLLPLLLDARPPKHGRLEWYEKACKAIKECDDQHIS